MEPEQPATTPQPATPLETPKKRSITLPIILMAWPAVSIILTIVLYAIINFIANNTAPTPVDGGLFGKTSPLQSIAQVTLFSVGAMSVALGPISFIVGLVLLIVRLQNK